MRCFFFGTGGRQLYGALHPAESVRTRSTAVVLAYPSLFEFNASHAAFRRLASLLERAGFPTLRFDYSGMGDSEGAPTESFCRDWAVDIATACHELSALSRARNICVVGLRIGATLAVQASSLTALDQLVLWEPVLSGQRYLEQLEQLDRRQRITRLYPRPAPRDELLGFSFSQAHRAELARLNVMPMSVPDGTGVSIVAPSSWPELPALTSKFPGAHLETFTRTEAMVDATDQSGMLSMEPLRAIVRSIERLEVA